MTGGIFYGFERVMSPPGTVSYYLCPTCAALTTLSGIEAHRAWHEVGAPVSTLAEQVAALQPGDEVEVTTPNGTRIVGVTIAGDGLLMIRYAPNNWAGLIIRRSNGTAPDYITAVRVITSAQPSCPFEIGATVYHVGGRGEPLTVEGWHPNRYDTTDPKWYVAVKGDARRFGPDALSLTMPEPPIGSIVQRNGVPGFRDSDSRWWFAGDERPWTWAGVVGYGRPLTVVRWGGANQ